MVKEKYIAFDCETGGLSSKDHTLLTTYFAVLDEDYEIIDDLYLELKDASGTYRVTDGAMNVNKIDLKEHDKVAITPEVALNEKLLPFLQKHVCTQVNKNGELIPVTEKLTPIAHNAKFDIGFIQAQLMPEEVYQKYISHRDLCTSNLARFLKKAGKLSGGGSLGAICETLGVQVGKEGFHNAQADTRATVECLKKMMEIMK